MDLHLNPIHRKSLESVDSGYILGLKADLRTLVRRVGADIRFELAGGLAIPLTFEQHPGEVSNFFKFPFEGQAIYRAHNAFHLNVYEDHLSKLEERLSRQEGSGELNYALVTHGSWHPFGRFSDTKIEDYAKVSAEEALKSPDLTKRADNLRFVRVKANGKTLPLSGRLDYIDVYPYRFESLNGEIVKPWFDEQFHLPQTSRVFSPQEVYVVSWDNKQGLLKLRADYYKGVSVQGEGLSIRLAGLHWVRLVKAMRKKPDNVDHYDIGLIDKFYKALSSSED